MRIPEGYRLVMRHVQPGQEYVDPEALFMRDEVLRHTRRWNLNAPSAYELPVLERIAPEGKTDDPFCFIRPRGNTDDRCFYCLERNVTEDHFNDEGMCKKRFTRILAPPPLPRRKLLVIVWEIVDHPANTLTQISPALAEAWVTPAYAEGVVQAGYVARIIDAPE